MNSTYKRRQFLRQMIGSITISTLFTSCRFMDKSKPRQPNIILFLADDLGYGDLGCYGLKDIYTPNIDGLAEKGVKFTNFYSNAPNCTPTRTALLTGRYQQRVGGLEAPLGVGNVGRYDDAIRLRESNDLGLPVSEISIAWILKNAGYNTAICGKWHLGYEDKFSPNNHGFDYAFYAIGGNMDYFHYIEAGPEKMYALYQNSQPVKREGYFTGLVTDESIKYIDRQSPEKPFFLYIPYTAPHAPYQGPTDYSPHPLLQDSPLWRQSAGHKDAYYAMIENMDESIGKILTKLNEKHLAENSLVIFMSDNGATPTGSNLPLSGFKGNVFEGGIRVPCVAKWPGKIPAALVSEQPCMTMDFSYSIVRIAGTEPPHGRDFDGIDILKLIEENKPVLPRTLFWRARRGNNTRKAVRHGDLKYIWLSDGAQVEEYFFDLNVDLSEKNNLISSRKEEVNQLKELLNQWETEVKPVR